MFIVVSFLRGLIYIAPSGVQKERVKVSMTRFSRLIPLGSWMAIKDNELPRYLVIFFLAWSNKGLTVEF